MTGERRSAAERKKERLRALVLQHDIEPGLDHHLDVLIGKLPDGEPWKARLAPLHKYTPYATTYRYATSGGRVPASPDAAGVAADAAHISELIADARQQLVGEVAVPNQRMRGSGG